MAEAVIASPRSWIPPLTANTQDLLATKTFNGDRTEPSTVFGGTVKLHVPSEEEMSRLRDFFADRFMRVQDDGCLRAVTGTKFKGAGPGQRELDNALKGADITTVTAEDLLQLIHEEDPDVDYLGSGEVLRRRVQLLADCCAWDEITQLSLDQLTDAVELYFESHQEVLLGRPILEGPTAMVMRGTARAALAPELLLANHKRTEVEAWRDNKRNQAKKKSAEISALQADIDAEAALITELIQSPKAWTRKGQAEIAAMKRQNTQKEATRQEMEAELSQITKDAELDVKSVLSDMWQTADTETQDAYRAEFRALLTKYVEPRVGMRVRVSALKRRSMHQKGVIDVSLAPGACDRMNKAAVRWFGNKSFEKGINPDIPAGTLANQGGNGTVKEVHKNGERVLVSWDRTGKMDWYCTGFNTRFDLALCDQDVGSGTSGFMEGLSSMRLLSNRADLKPREAADRVELRRQRYLGATQEVPDYHVEGDKHIGREYDRLTGTGYL